MDDEFLSAPHKIETGGGFATTLYLLGLFAGVACLFIPMRVWQTLGFPMLLLGLALLIVVLTTQALRTGDELYNLGARFSSGDVSSGDVSSGDVSRIGGWGASPESRIRKTLPNTDFGKRPQMDHSPLLARFQGGMGVLLC